MLQYDLKPTYRLTKCSNGEGSPEFSITAEATNRYVAGERFEVDYEALTSIMKTTSFGVTFHDAGTLRSINAAARDRTGPILADVARIGVSIASLVAGAPVPLMGESPVIGAQPEGIIEPALRRRLTCSQAAAGYVAARDSAASQIKLLTPEVERLTEEVTRLATLATAQAALPEDRQRYREAVNNLLLQQQELRRAQAAMANADAELSVSFHRSWPTEAGNIHATVGTIDLEQQSLAKLTALFVIPSESGDMPAAGAEVSCNDLGNMLAEVCLRHLTRLNLILEPVTVQQFNTVDASATSRDEVISVSDRAWARGILIREPTQARVFICRSADQPRLVPPPGAREPESGAPRHASTCSNRVIYRGELLTAPQFGRLRLLPFSNGPFEEGELKLSLRADGTIESFSYGEESAAAGAASNLATIAERIDTGLERIETERRSDVQYARDTRTYERNEAAAVRTEAAAVRAEEIAQLTHERDLLVRRREVLMAEAGLTAAEIEALTTPINAELAQLNARIAVLRSTNDLTALQAAQAGQ